MKTEDWLGRRISFLCCIYKKPIFFAKNGENIFREIPKITASLNGNSDFCIPWNETTSWSKKIRSDQNSIPKNQVYFPIYFNLFTIRIRFCGALSSSQKTSLKVRKNTKFLNSVRFLVQKRLKIWMFEPARRNFSKGRQFFCQKFIDFVRKHQRIANCSKPKFEQQTFAPNFRRFDCRAVIRRNGSFGYIPSFLASRLSWFNLFFVKN